MGRNHARVVHESSSAHLAHVIDRDWRRAQEISAAFGGQTGSDWRVATTCDAAIVATPTEFHVEIALELLDAGLSVLVEKPLAVDADDTVRLIQAGRESAGALMCGFVERFNPAFVAARNLLVHDAIHIVGIRHSPAAPRIRTSVVQDLLIHDIDLVIQLAAEGDKVEHVSAEISDPLGRGVADVADCVLRFSSGLIATLSASRSSHRKLRDVQINDGEQLIAVDLLRQNVDVYRHVRHELASGASYREETVHDIPFVRRPGEPLALQFEHFLGLMAGTRDRQRELDLLLPAHEVASRLC
jgi:predicted dehydrogenase